MSQATRTPTSVAATDHSDIVRGEPRRLRMTEQEFERFSECGQGLAREVS